MLRVLRPGGELVILELSVPSNAVIRWLFNLYFLHILPLIGGKVSGDKAAYRYLPASVLNFPGKKEFMGTLRGCGFRNVRHKAFTLGICRMYSGENSFKYICLRDNCFMVRTWRLAKLELNLQNN